MRSRRKALKNPSSTLNAVIPGRITRSKSATPSILKTVGRLTQLSSTPNYKNGRRATLTLSSYSQDSSASDAARSSSRSYSNDDVDESDAASSDFQGMEEQVDSSPDGTEEASDDVSTTYPSAPPSKRLKISQQNKINGEPLAAESAKPKPPCSLVKMKDAWSFKNGINEGLPPIKNIVEIFDDITKKAIKLGLGEAIQHLGSRKLKLATMCSGTESPVLALQLVSESLKKYYGINFEIEHMFSAEIVPFKQAYIERNFHPSIIFRDVREMIHSNKASTAYGSEAEIPSDVDILVAGFSCVDFSRLNAWRKDLKTVGESGDTFRSILNYATEKRPALVVLENVLSAPWDDIAEFWDTHAGYAAMHVKPDTKQYYIPHTRQRGYMLCIDKQRLKSAKASVAEWGQLMGAFQRPASSPVEAFLLPEDDPRVQLAREEMAKSVRGDEKPSRNVDWTLCQGRHQDYRAEKCLGTKRPLTGWLEGGSSGFPDYGWIDWNKAQTDRVKDTCDVSYLRSAARGFDFEYKPRSIELSQNIDRFTDSTPPGITNCITPTGQPYITTRGGPIIGLEALALQGLPIDNLLLTRENPNQLQDLAGNAMTSTVVGPAILSALIVGREALPKGAKLPQKTTQRQTVEIEDDYSRLSELSLGLAEYDDIEVATLLAEAERSRRLCYCEGQILTNSKQVQRCTECLHTTCKKCGGTPTHAYKALDTETVNMRLSPQAFEEKVKKALPMRLTIPGFSRGRFEELRISSPAEVPAKTWEQYINAIVPALGEELRFHSMRRTQTWTIHYDAPCSRLELLLHPHKAEWRLYAKVSKQEPGDSKVRQLLALPFARMSPNTYSLFAGQWQFCLPSTTQVPITIEGKGRQVRPWESRIGLQAKDFADKLVWTDLHVKVRQEFSTQLDLNISGDYKWLPDCGTASCGLHKKLSGDDTSPIFFFLDPDRTGNPVHDQFVFSTDIHRLSYGEVRSTIARAGSSWRPSAHEGLQHVQCSFYGQWIDCPSAGLKPFAGSGATFAVPSSDLQITVAQSKRRRDSSVKPTKEGCAVAVNTLLRCSVPLSSGEDVGWKKGVWVEVNKTNERALFVSFAWLTEKARDLNGFSNHWRHLQLPADHDRCQECAPDRPLIAWRLEKKQHSTKFVPYENPRQAGLYERAIKARPAPFITRVRIDDSNTGQLTIGLNVCTLVHRALANLCGVTSHKRVKVSWRLDTNFVWQPRVSFPSLTLLSNKADEEAAQPPNLVAKLRPDQLRSLSWMLSQEAHEVQPFVEEEVEEAVLTQMGWRAEGRATHLRTIRGGVLADVVGYGKTLITLGLIDTQFSEDTWTPGTAGNGKIPIKATLIVLPRHLIPQWTRQISKFVRSTYVVLTIQDQRKLGACTIQDFINADIIIAAWSMFDNATYLERLEQFAALPEAPATSGRAFQTWYTRARDRTARHLDVLISTGASALAELLKTDLAAAEKDEELLKFVPSKRLRGTVYAAAQASKATTLKSGIEAIEGPTGTCAQPGRKRLAEALNAPVEEPLQLSRKPKVGNGDPFNLKSMAAKTKWECVKCPLFELFEFNRLVVDEFTYIGDKDSTFITTLKANHRWVLSGTPPLDDFADVKTIAGFLGINLGIDDDAVGVIKGRNVNEIRKDRTTVERFQAFRQVHSPHWHLNRHGVAQRFLNQYARQNEAEIDEIPYREHIRPILLPAAERASYMELNQQILSQDMKLPRGGRAKIDNDRTNRLREIMGTSKTPEEALLKRCSHFTLEDLGINRENASQDCDLIIQVRMNQHKDTLAELKTNLKHAAWLKEECKEHDEHFTKWTRNVKANALGDLESKDLLLSMIEKAKKEYSKKHEELFYREPPTPEEKAAKKKRKQAREEAETAAKEPAKGEYSEDESGDVDVLLTEVANIEPDDPRPIRLTEVKDKVQALRTLTGHLRNLAKELVSRVRALRFFKVVRAVQLWQSELPAGGGISQAPACSGCKTVAQHPSATYVLGLCGHTACESCLNHLERGGECISAGCDAPAHKHHIHKATELGQEDRKAREGRHYGKKLEVIMDLIKRKIPVDEQVLLFVQFDDLIEKVSAALKYHGIEHYAISEKSSRYAAKWVDDFQENQGREKKKVLVLNLANETAAGMNLVNANHAIFLSPLLAETRHHYNSSMKQAIGRVVRYGQAKLVHIYRFLSLKTIDIDILQERTQKKLAKVNGRWGLYSESEIPEKDKEDWGGGLVKAQYLGDSD
ncbi:MAG: hypothetical protein M1830_004631 [Pleopsidium flavum]|nr:MAG: hypothetical protein M1830_004631 [Pleopsidium flavum]